MIYGIRNNRPGLYDAGGHIKLLPGVNLLNTPKLKAAWERAKKNPVVASRLRPNETYPGGELKELKVKAAGDDEQTSIPLLVDTDTDTEVPKTTESGNLHESDSLDGLKRPEKLALVASCEDVALLESWHAQETDTTVKSKTTERILELSGGDDD